MQVARFSLVGVGLLAVTAGALSFAGDTPVRRLQVEEVLRADIVRRHELLQGVLQERVRSR